MRTRIRVLTALTSLLLLALACSLPGATSEPSLSDRAATLVVQTLNAPIPSQSSFTQSPTQPTASPARSPTLPANGTPTGTITPTYSVPMLKVDEPTNCRSGPGPDYQIITTFQPGTSAEIVGRYPENNWWLINNPFGEGTCWIWGQFATVSGSTWTVPSVTPPPPATQGLPTPPSVSSWDYSCAYGSSGPNVTFNLKWSDRATDEIGYRIYRNDELVTELPANSSSFSEVVDIQENEKLTYRLEVYNNAGTSSAAPITFSCQ